MNPVVAVFLCWALGGEALTSRTMLAAAIIVAAVVIITSQRSKTNLPGTAEMVPSIVQAE